MPLAIRARTIPQPLSPLASRCSRPIGTLSLGYNHRDCKRVLRRCLEGALVGPKGPQKRGVLIPGVARGVV